MLSDKKQVPGSLPRIDVSDERNIRYWCAYFSVGRDELLACILEVGPIVSDVERKLKHAARVTFDKMGED